MDVEDVIRRYEERRTRQVEIEFTEILREAMQDQTVDVMLIDNGQTRRGDLRRWREDLWRGRVIGTDLAMDPGEFVYRMDPRSPDMIQDFFRVMGNMDLILDGSSHIFEDQWMLLMHAISALKTNGIYIIMDISRESRDMFLRRRTMLEMRHRVASIHAVGNSLVFVMQKPSELIIATAAGQEEARDLIRFACALITNKIPFHQLIVYDLGLDPVILRTVKDMFSTRIIDIRNFDHRRWNPSPQQSQSDALPTWRPLLISEIATEIRCGLLLWSEPSSCIEDLDSLPVLNDLPPKQKESPRQFCLRLEDPTILDKLQEWRTAAISSC